MELSKCFKALSDKTRLRLLYILDKYELNVNEIVMVVEMIQSGVSRHLKILVESGLLHSRREGSYTYYSAPEDSLVRPLIDFVDRNIKANEHSQKDIRKAREMIRIRQNNTKRFFKGVAHRWDHLKKEFFGAFDLNRVLVEKMTFSGSVADLGCGTGELIERIAERASLDQIIGVDSSPEMLEQARMKLAGTGAHLRLGELEHLPVRNREMETAVMNMVLHHIPQPILPIAEAFRILKPGGLFLLSDFEKHDNKRVNKSMGGAWLGFEKEKIEAWLVQAGFSLDTVDSYPVNQGLIINLFSATKPNAKEST